MRFTRSIIFNLVFLFLFYLPSWSGESTDLTPISATKEEGISFSIPYAQLMDVPAPERPQSGSIPLSEEKFQRLVIRLTVKNENETKKVDLTQPFHYVLTDEYNNAYNQLEPSTDAPESLNLKNKNYPSIYPGELFTQTLFFEAPLTTSQTLTLNIDASGLEISDNVQLQFPTAKITRPFTSSIGKIVDDDLLFTTSHLTRQVRPGELLHVSVKFNPKSKRPDMITVMSPNYVLEDATASGEYDVRVTRNQRPGNFIVAVMAKWKDAEENRILSKSLTFQVIDLKKECVENCMQQLNIAEANEVHAKPVRR